MFRRHIIALSAPDTRNLRRYDYCSTEYFRLLKKNVAVVITNHVKHHITIIGMDESIASVRKREKRDEYEIIGFAVPISCSSKNLRSFYPLFTIAPKFLPKSKKVLYITNKICQDLYSWLIFFFYMRQTGRSTIKSAKRDECKGEFKTTRFR